MNNSRRIAWGVAAGVAVGSAVAALYGTKRGADLRKKIVDFTSQHAGEAGTALTGIVSSLGAIGSTQEESNTRNENKNGHTPEKGGRKDLVLPQI